MIKSGKITSKDIKHQREGGWMYGSDKVSGFNVGNECESGYSNGGADERGNCNNNVSKKPNNSQGKKSYILPCVLFAIVIIVLLVCSMFTSYAYTQYEVTSSIQWLLVVYILECFMDVPPIVFVLAGGVVIMAALYMSVKAKAYKEYRRTIVLKALILSVCVVGVLFLAGGAQEDDCCIAKDTKSRIEVIGLLVQDYIHNETIEMQVDSFETEARSILHSSNSSRPSGYNISHHVNINKEYVIRTSETARASLSNLAETGKPVTFTMYKNSHIITHVNGIPIAEFRHSRSMMTKIAMDKSGVVYMQEYDYIKNNEAIERNSRWTVYKGGKVVKMAYFVEKETELLNSLMDGVYEVKVTHIDKVISNTIRFEKKDGEYIIME